MRAEAWVALRLAIRHHPLCDRFDADRIGPVCSGCAMFWPAAAIAAPVAASAWTAGASAWGLFAAAVVLGAPQVLGLAWRTPRPVRAGIKLLAGASVGTAVPAILLLPLPVVARAALGIAMLAAFAGILAQRMRRILRTCDACTWRRDWARCPGFGALDAAGNTTLTWQEPQP